MNANTLDDFLPPCFCKEGLQRFTELISHSKNYVEYGAGGSTALACKFSVPHVFSVESDRAFVDFFRPLIDPFNGVVVNHINIGPTKEWGYPVNDSAFRNYSNYPMAPWTNQKVENYEVDLVLIDGRFRVASFLATLLFTSPDTKILFDDYADRISYHVVEKVCLPTKVHGRMAEFIRPESLNTDLTISIFVEYLMVTA